MKFELYLNVQSFFISHYQFTLIIMALFILLNLFTLNYQYPFTNNQLFLIFEPITYQHIILTFYRVLVLHQSLRKYQT